MSSSSLLSSVVSEVALCALLLVPLQSHASQAQKPAAPGPGMDLYRRLRTVGLDAQNVYKVRDASISREDVHISLNDGTISFLEPVNGHITGALFQGQGEILLIPPNQVERQSLALFTKAAVLSEIFTVAYLRFNDDKIVDALRPALRPIDPADTTQFLQTYGSVAKALAETDALRTLIALTHEGPPNRDGGRAATGNFLGAHLSGQRLGNFEVTVDDVAGEQIAVGTTSYSEKGRFYDLWTAFPMRSTRELAHASSADSSMAGSSSRRTMTVTDYQIRTQLQPPTDLAAETTLTLQVSDPGDRTLIFELSRYLKLSAVTLEEGGSSLPVEFIQNEAIEGSQLARRGNDLVAVILPRPLAVETVKLKFSYAGPVMQDAGGGLLYVGARGTWFPNLGPAMSSFDLEFHTPPGWKLLATGKLMSKSTGADGQEVSRWRSEQPIPLAGFNLGRYSMATATSKTELGDVAVEAYATRGMENTFVARQNPSVTVLPPSGRRRLSENVIDLPAAGVPDPAHNALAVATECARTIDFLAPRLGKYPYASLSLTQRPGPDSQGWPGLVFLSSYAFLTPQQRAAERRHATNPVSEILYNGLMASHETAHQWWGDAVFWQDYRSEWMMEALANYSALMKLESEHPERFKVVMDSYRENLEKPDSPSSSRPVKEAGPVSLGPRLNSSQFPSAYDDIVYGRGTWLIHMLREMFRDAGQTRGAAITRAASGKKARRGSATKENIGPAAKLSGSDPDAAFFSVLRGIQGKFRGALISNSDLKAAFEAALPLSLRFEGKKSLDWFFDGWVDGAAIPKYELEDVTIKAGGAGSVAVATLHQKDAPESLVTSVPIYASTGPGAPVFVERVFADGEETAIKLNVPRGTKSLVVDPYHTVLTAK